MNYLNDTIYWCVLQVSVLALLGVIASILVVRSRPTSARSILCATAAIAAALTAIAPLPVHRMFLWESRAQEVQATTVSSFVPTILTTSAEKGERTTPMLNIGEVAAIIQGLTARTYSVNQRSRALTTVLVYVLLSATLVGLLRLALGIASALRIHAGSIAVCDSRLATILSAVSSRLGDRRCDAAYENDQLSSAAVVGWFRPRLVLPNDWKHWSDAELEAVVAHELAHIAQQDSLWRALAVAVTAVHFYNPFVHWLMRRMMLCQELSADELAASVVGRSRYLRSLSSLAIHRDRQFDRGHTALLPVFSGDLIRRIKMLRSMEGTSQDRRQHPRSIVSAIASSAIVMLAVGTIAVRGLAQPPSGPTKQADKNVARVARAVTTATNPSGTDPIQGMFNRVPLPAGVIAANNRGMVVLRLRELLQQPDIKPYVSTLNSFLSQWLQSVLKSDEMLQVDVAAIEWVAGNPMLRIDVNDDKTADHEGRIVFGAGGFVVKLHEPIDLKQWIERYSPSSMHFVVEGRDVFQLPAMPALGPAPMWLSMHDDGTILANAATVEITTETNLSEIFTPQMVSGKTNESRWVSSWDRIEGGLVSVVVTDAEVYDLGPGKQSIDEFERATEELVKALCLRCNTLAIGVDVAPGTSNMGTRIRLTHSSRGPANKSAQQIRDFIALAKSKFTNGHADKEGDRNVEELKSIAQFVEAIGTITASVEDADGGAADVVLSAVIPFNYVVQLSAQAATEDVASDSTPTNVRR